MDGTELRRRRKNELQMTQAELAERIGVRQPSLSAWERGVKPIGNPRMLALALRALALERAAGSEGEDGAPHRAATEATL